MSVNLTRDGATVQCVAHTYILALTFVLLRHRPPSRPAPPPPRARYHRSHVVSGLGGEGRSTAFVVSLSCVCCKYWRRGPATWHTRLSTAAARCAGVARFTNTGVPAYHTPDAIRRHAGGGISAGEMLQYRAHMHVQTDPCH